MSNRVLTSHQFGKVAVLYGGYSAERDVSLASGQAVFDALKRCSVDAHLIDVAPDNVLPQLSDGYDRVFIALHGKWGEDGVLQGVLDTLRLPYTGSGVLACALAMDKIKSKQVWRGLDLPVAKDKLVLCESDLMKATTELGLPLFVKPVSEGSSVGGSKVNNKADVSQAYQKAANQGVQVMAEQFILGDELTVAILNQQAMSVIRMQTSRDFYDYKAKYQKGFTQYHCPAGLTDELEQKARDLALMAYQSIGCQGWGRVDLMLDANQNLWLLEVNTVPGMTQTSLVPQAASHMGIDFDSLVMKILEQTLGQKMEQTG